MSQGSPSASSLPSPIRAMTRASNMMSPTWKYGSEVSPIVSARDMSPAQASAERRQLTLLFCDLVGSTSLARELDVEDLRAVIAAYHRRCTETIERNGGYVAKYMVDGLLVYFGYPQAHEHDAERAVSAGLELVNAMRDLSTRAGRCRCASPLASRAEAACRSTKWRASHAASRFPGIPAKMVAFAPILRHLESDRQNSGRMLW